MATDSLSVSSAPSTESARQMQIPVSRHYIRSIDTPGGLDVRIIHAYVKIADFPHGDIPEDVNPRSHDENALKSRVATRIQESVEKSPEDFHLLNRGLLVIASRAWYDNKREVLHINIDSFDQGGLADGATTDRVLSRVKRVAEEFAEEHGTPDYVDKAYVHVEVVAGDGIASNEAVLRLTDARNTSIQVKPWSLADLGGSFDWLKKIIENSRFKNKVRYEENGKEPVDIRAILGLLTLFHPNWDQEGRHPIVAYTGKGRLLQGYYEKNEWKAGYRALAPVVLDILELYEYIKTAFEQAYKDAFGATARLGRRKEVDYRDKPTIPLYLTGEYTQYGVPDGWVYPILGSLRGLLDERGDSSMQWHVDAKEFFVRHGPKLVQDVVEMSEQLGRNAQSTGKSRVLWQSLHQSVELMRLRTTA